MGRWDKTRVEYAIHALMYMIGNKNCGAICSEGCDAHGPFQIHAFADGSLGNESKSRSRAARLVKMSGAAIAAKTNKTTTVHVSSCSVETDAACQAALGIVALRHLLEEVGIWYNGPVVIYEDNIPTIRVANNEPRIADAGRHMDIKNFKLGELVENSTIVLKYIETQRQVADLLTKPLGKVAFERPRGDLAGYLAFDKPGENIHVKHMRIHVLK